MPFNGMLSQTLDIALALPTGDRFTFYLVKKLLLLSVM